MKLVQIDFEFDGPFGKELLEARSDVARDIAGEPGLIWKVWTEEATEGRGGGIYLFEDEASAVAYCEKQRGRMDHSGYRNIRVLVLDVNEDLSRITRAPL